jgi:hypothetical protein
MESLLNPRLTRYNKITSLLVAAQTYRIFGVVFLWGVSQGILHPAFGIPTGVGDILVGATAIPFAYFLRKGFSWSKYALVIWSVLGITDLVNAVSLGLITSEFSSSAMTIPLSILVPTVVTPPLALTLYGITLYRLRNIKLRDRRQEKLEEDGGTY